MSHGEDKAEGHPYRPVPVDRPPPTSGEELVRRYEAGERDFSGLDLQGVNLKGAELEGVHFTGADLSSPGAYRKSQLGAANLSDAKLIGTNLAEPI